LEGVREVIVEPDGDYTAFNLRLEANSDPSEEVMRLAMSRHWAVRELVRRRASLEDVFVDLTHSDS
jgi:ABC-2 type transport system ATP-binding protein